MVRMSASGLPLAELCAASAGLPHVGRLTPAGQRGTGLHAEQERESPEGAEVAFAYDVMTGKARELGRRLARQYPPTTETEIVGTTDKLTVEADRVIIRDYKSGAGFSVPPPAENLQLGFYAVAAADVYGKDAARVEIEFLDRDYTPHADLDAFDLAALRARIASVWRAANEPNPRIVTGDHCTGCPALRNCPAHLTMAVAFTEGLWPGVLPTDGLTVERVAQGWEFLGNAKRLLGLVEKTYRAFASEWPVPLSNGRTLGAHEVEREELDGPVTFQVLRDLHGEQLARAAVSMETTKASLERVLAPLAPKRGLAKMMRETLEVLRANNGVVVKRAVRVEEFNSKES